MCHAGSVLQFRGWSVLEQVGEDGNQEGCSLTGTCGQVLDIILIKKFIILSRLICHISSSSLCTKYSHPG